MVRHRMATIYSGQDRSVHRDEPCLGGPVDNRGERLLASGKSATEMECPVL